jgi:hypothetical protein
MAELEAARELWTAGRLEDGLPIPAPLPPEHSGIINLRMPPALHYQLAREASRNGVSLNQWLNMALAEFVGAAAINSATRSRSLSQADSHRPGIEPAISPLRQTLNDHGREPLAGLPASHGAFLRGLLQLKQCSFEAAFSSFLAAREDGLDFTNDAVRIYRAMPERLTHRELLDLLMQLSHVIPGDTANRTGIHLLLGAWLERVRENPISHDQWVRWGRAKRKTAERIHLKAGRGGPGDARHNKR